MKNSPYFLPLLLLVRNKLPKQNAKKIMLLNAAGRSKRKGSENSRTHNSFSIIIIIINPGELIQKNLFPVLQCLIIHV